MDEETVAGENQNVPKKTGDKRNLDGTFAVGNPGGPGRPKGLTIKEQVRKWLEEHPADNKNFIEHFVRENRQLAWRMLEGNPQQDITSGGEKLPTPLLANIIVDAISNNDGGKEDSGAPKTD